MCTCSNKIHTKIDSLLYKIDSQLIASFPGSSFHHRYTLLQRYSFENPTRVLVQLGVQLINWACNDLSNDYEGALKSLQQPQSQWLVDCVDSVSTSIYKLLPY